MALQMFPGASKPWKEWSIYLISFWKIVNRTHLRGKLADPFNDFPRSLELCFVYKFLFLEVRLSQESFETGGWFSLHVIKTTLSCEKYQNFSQLQPCSWKLLANLFLEFPCVLSHHWVLQFCRKGLPFLLQLDSCPGAPTWGTEGQTALSGTNASKLKRPIKIEIEIVKMSGAATQNFPGREGKGCTGAGTGMSGPGFPPVVISL